MDESLHNLATLFPSLDKLFLEDVYVSSKKDFDKTVDQLLSMGVELDVGKKEQKATPAPVNRPPPTASTQPFYSSNTSPPQVAAPLVPLSIPHPITPGSPRLAPVLPHSITPAPTMNYPSMFNVPATPPPINTASNLNSSGVSSPTPTAPPAATSKPANENQADQKRLETMKQELSMEYQRINDKHKYNLELQQKLEQLSDFTAAEQRKLEEQRTAFQEDKRRFTEELTSRFKAMQEDQNRLKEQLQRQEEDRVALFEAEAEANRQAKAAKRGAKLLRMAEDERERQDAESRRLQSTEQEKCEIQQMLEQKLVATKFHYENALGEKDNEMRKLQEAKDDDIRELMHEIEALKTQLANSAKSSRDHVATSLTTLVTSITEGISAASREKVVGSDQSEIIAQFQHTLFRTIANSLQRE
jgi:hypothetical protein